MTARDRTVLIVVGLLAALAAFWFLAIGPKRKDASDLSTQVSAAQQRLATAQSSAQTADAARKRYASDYATVARLGKAVPVDDDVPSLVYQLQSVADSNKVNFKSIRLNSSAGGSTTTSSGSSASTVTTALPPGATVGTAGFPTMPFSFDFGGKFFNLQRFLRAVDNLTAVDGKQISVKGRLLTVDGIALKAGPNGFPDVDATVAVTAYLLPSDEGLTSGASASAPGAATPSTGSTATASLIGGN